MLPATGASATRARAVTPVSTSWKVKMARSCSRPDILSRSTGLSQVRSRRTLDDRVDLLLRPPVAGFGVLDFKGGIALFETGYQYAVEALAKSGLADRFVT